MISKTKSSIHFHGKSVFFAKECSTNAKGVVVGGGGGSPSRFCHFNNQRGLKAIVYKYFVDITENN